MDCTIQLHGTGGLADHGFLAGLADDDHTQYLLDGAGRASVQSLIGGLAAGDTLDLQGADSGGADVGRVHSLSPFEIEYGQGNTTPAEQVAQRWRPTFTTGGPYLGGWFQNNADITYDNSFYIFGDIVDSSIHNAAAGPGFAAWTLFLAQSIIQNSGNFDLVQALTLLAGVRHRRATSGTSVVTGNVGVAASPVNDANVSGAILTKSLGDTAVSFGPQFNCVGGATVNMGTAVGLDVSPWSVILFGSSAGTENATAMYGLRMQANTFPTSGDKAALRNEMTDATDRFCIQNPGGARSDFGGGNLFDCGFLQILADNISLSLGAAGGDLQVNWNGSALEYDPLVGDDLRWSFASGSHTLQSSQFGSGADLMMGFDRFAFGQTSAPGNQVGVFVAPARATGVNGGWSDFLLTQAGNLTINHTMSDVAAWTINSISLTGGTGSITGYVATFQEGGMTTSGLGSALTAAHRTTGRTWLRGTTQVEPINPSNLSGSVTGWAGLLSGSPNNNHRGWARITCDAATTLHGIDATAAQDGDTFDITNVGANALTVANQSGTETTAANRIILGGHSGTLGVDETMTIRYDGTTQRWRVLFSN